MNWIVNGHNIFEIVLVTFLVSTFLVPLTKKIAHHVGAMDIPNERKIHKVPIPRLGGLAIYGAFLLGYILYGDVTTQMLSILIGSFLIIMVGFIDDIKSVRALYKFVVQIVAALIVVIYGQIYFTEITFLGFHLEFNQIISYILSTFFILAISNAINLIDGLDGLSSGVSSIYFLTIAIIAFILNKVGGLDIILSLIMLGATLGFLVHNFPPAKTFVGDSGSVFLGFMISIIALLGFKVATLTSLVIPITVLAIPIIDTVMAILRRLLKGESIGTPDKEHFHHQLLKMKFSPRVSILIIYSINIMFSVISILYVIGDSREAIILYCVLLIMLLFVILKTDILYTHHSKEEKSSNKKGKKSKK